MPTATLALSLAFVGLLLAGCTKTETTEAGGSAAASDVAYNEIQVTGSVTLDTAAQDQVGPVELSGKTVELQDSNGEVVASGTLQPTGAYTIALSTSGAALTDDRAGAVRPKVFTLKSLFTAGANSDAIGVNEQLVINPSQAVPVASAGLIQTSGSVGSIEVGEATASKVGAIHGKIKLETNEDPTGIDVYIPGTQHIAKTGSTGEFLIGFLPRGAYTIRADRGGFGSIVWEDVRVEKDETTHLAESLMRISSGPKVEKFALKNGSAISLTPTLELTVGLRGASKFRLSQLSDFRDTVYRPVDATQPEFTVTFQLSGNDGNKVIYLEAADTDGLTAQSTLTLLLDTTVPLAGKYNIRSDAAQPGYSNSLSPRLFATDCNDVTALLATEEELAAPPAPEALTLSCAEAAAAGVPISLSAGQGAKSVKIWVKDAANQVAAIPAVVTVELDTTTPVIAVLPASGAFNETIEIKTSSDSKSVVHYTFDLSNPTKSSPIVGGGLVLIATATMKLLAIDFAGNESAIQTINYTIDRDKPLLASIALNAASSTLGSLSVPLTVSALGATKMRFAESPLALAAAGWLNYATNHTYTLVGTSDGAKEIFADFSDDAGNINASSTTVQVTLDRTAPEVEKIVLYQPETPSGSFDKLLAWQSLFQGEGISFEVEVSQSSTFATIDRTMTSEAASVRTSPPLSAAGTYYWRVRAKDEAGNASAWVASGDELKFVVRILFESRQSERDFKAQPGEIYFGQETVNVGDLTGDSVPEIAFSITSSEYNMDPTSCVNCNSVKIMNVATNQVVGVLNEGQGRSSGFGKKVITCDLDPSEPGEEIVVSANSAAFIGTETSGAFTYEVKYLNAGAVYVYRRSDLQQIAQLAGNLGATPSSQYGYCQQWGAYGCVQYGWAKYPMPVETWFNVYDGLSFGQDLACERVSGAHRLVVAEPGYYDSIGGLYGRVSTFTYSSGDLVPFGTPLLNTEANSNFAESLAYLGNFHFGTGPANCSTDGPKLAVGLPRYLVSGYETGAVQLFQRNANAWEECDDMILPEAGDDPYQRYGARLFNLGNIDQAVDDIDKLAVATNGGEGGIVRIFPGTGTAPLKAIKKSGDAYRGFGYVVAAAGDYSSPLDSQSEILITAPMAALNGNWDAGIVHVYRLSDLDNNASGGAAGNPFVDIEGEVRYYANFGAAVAVIHPGGDIHEEPSKTLISRPRQEMWEMETGWTPPPYPTGLVNSISVVRMAPSVPYSIEGKTANARFGHSIIANKDLNSDKAPDFIIGQPGARCMGRPYGAVSLFSVKDKQETFSICMEAQAYNNKNKDLGFEVLRANSGGGDEEILFFNKNNYKLTMGGIENQDFLAFEDTKAVKAFEVIDLEDGTGDGRWVEYQDISLDSSAVAISQLGPNSELLIGDYSSSGSYPGVRYLRYRSDSLNFYCRYSGEHAEHKFGSGLAVAGDVNSDSYNDLVIGAPNYDSGDSLGKIYVVSGETSTNCTNAGNSKDNVDAATVGVGVNQLYSLDADSTLFTGAGGIDEKAQAGFGAFVANLGDLDGPGTGQEAYLLVANTNLRLSDTDDRVPQYFVLGLDVHQAPGSEWSIIWHEKGEAGSMLGSNALAFGDINKDGTLDVAVAYPGGTGSYGKTGQVKILSGKALGTPASTNKLMQVLFNPSTASDSNFGMAFSFGDISGDGLPDMIIGADKHDSALDTDAGAIHVFPLLPIKL